MPSTPQSPLSSSAPTGASAVGETSAASPSGEHTRQGVPVSTLDGVHPGLAITAMGPDEEDVPVVVEPDAWVGRVLSNVYRVEQKIGEGGMGAVYLARHIHLQKPYAIKVLTTTVANNGQAVERLKQEAIAASSIEHDNIVDVVNFDRADDGSVFIVMELLRGESLHARLARGPMAPSEALPIAWQICAALGAAHARGIVHRDLKPENVFLAKRGDGERVKVLDFGISKVKSAEADGVRMTRTGQLVGTPLYMSPEQAKGEQDIDLRVDVYALGVMLYEMLVGAPPFDGRNYFELLWKHGNEPPPSMRSRKEGLPEALDRVVLRALAKDRDARFASMEAFSLALEEAVPEVTRTAASLTSIPPEGRRSQAAAATQNPQRPPAPTEDLAPPVSRMPLYAALGVAALLSGVGIAWGMRGDEVPAPNPATAEARATAGREPTPLPEREEREPEPPLGVEVPPLEEIVTVSFGGTPSGIEVVDETGAVLCVTPCMHDLPDGPPVVLSFRHDGYLEESRSIVPSRDAVVELRLRPRRRTSPAGEEGSGLHLKTTL